MRVWVAAALMITTLAGCAGNEEPVLEDAPDANHVDAPDARLGLAVAAPENITAGVPMWINITATAADANATWDYTIHNGTAINGTFAEPAVLSGNGTGLPATLNLTLAPGNQTLTFISGNDTLVHVFDVAAAVADADIDPCEGAAVQEALAFSGTATGGALGSPAGPSHSFEVLPCQSQMTVELSYLQSGGDMDIDIFDPNGDLAGSGASGSIGSEGPIVVKGPLAAGEWTVEIVFFSSGPSTYDLDVTFG